MPPSIFISYRRDDAAGDAGRLADHLHKRFGPDRVFVDVDTIEPGTDFVAALRGSLEKTAALLVVIGPRWVSLRAADGGRRLDDPNDFVRLEVETALGRGIPVVPILVQGAVLPRADEVPASLAPLITRQVVVLDHAEFHADADRLCDWLIRTTGGDTERRSRVRRWWAAVVIPVLVLGLGFATYRALRDDRANVTATATAPTAQAREQARRVDELLAEAAMQRRRSQFVESLATLARARELAPDSEPVRQMQEDVAMHWMRNVRFQADKSSFSEAIKPALAVIDAELPSATGSRRADLLAHSAWAAFLMWRDGNRQVNPAELYEEALAADPGNPYANAMLAHWILFRGDDVPRAVKLFDTALQSKRATDAIRSLQWSAYANAGTAAAQVQLVRLADAMRREGKKLSTSQAQTLWGPYYSMARVGRESERTLLLDAVPPDDHLSTLDWALEEYAQAEPSRRLTIRYYVALLHARAGRSSQAADELKALLKDLSNAGSLRDAVAAALKQLQSGK